MKRINKELLNKYILAVINNSKTVIAATLFVTLFMLYNVSSLKLVNDLDRWLPQTDPIIVSTEKINENFGGRHVVVIGLLPKDGNLQNEATLASAERIRQDLLKIPSIIESNVFSLTADKVRDIRGTESGMEIRSFSEVNDFKEAIIRNNTLRGTLVSDDLKATAILADFEYEGFYNPLYNEIMSIVNKERSAELDIVVGGAPVEAAQLERAMEKMPIYFAIAFMIIMVVQLITFGSFQGMFLPMLSSVLAIIWGLGTFSLLGQKLDPVNSMTPILILSVASGHAIQLLKRYYDELSDILSGNPSLSLKQANREAIVASLSKVGPVLIVAGFIVSLAFFSFLSSDIKILRDFGLLAGISVLCILAVEFTFVPAFRALLPVKVPAGHTKYSLLDRVFGFVSRVLSSRKKSLVVFSIVLLGIVILGSGIQRLEVTSTSKEYNLPGTQIRIDNDKLNSTFAGVNTFSILIEGKPGDIKDVNVLRGMEEIQAVANRFPNVGKTISIADYIKRMNAAMHGDELSFNVIPDTTNAVAQYLLLYSFGGDGADFDNLVNQDYSKAVIWVYSKDDSSAEILKLKKQLEQISEKVMPKTVSVEYGGSLLEKSAINEAIVKSKLLSLLQMAFIIFIFTALYFRSFVAGGIVSSPVVIVVICNVGLMGWLGIPLDMGTATVTTIVAGLGADYEIYMLSRLREEYKKDRNLSEALNRSLQTAGKAVVYVTLSIAAGYSALLFAEYQFYPRLGLTMIMSALISCVLSILFLRALIALIKPKFIIKE